MKNKILYTALAGSFFVPLVSFAALGGLKNLLIALRGLINNVIPVVIGLGVIYFLWGVSQFIFHDAGNDKTREEGRRKMLWGIIALFIMFSIFGILRFIGNSVGISVSNTSGGGTSDPCSVSEAWTVPGC